MPRLKVRASWIELGPDNGISVQVLIVIADPKLSFSIDNVAVDLVDAPS